MRDSLLLLVLFGSTISAIDGCSMAHEQPGADAGAPRIDASMPIDARALADAWAGHDAWCVSPMGAQGLIPADVAECLGLAAPECAYCHVESDQWFLRPMTPSPPSVQPPASGACALCPR
ncbi:MAG: hypothetical protein U0234_21675 [Sandaracinus sp.]